MTVDERLPGAKKAYERMIFGDDSSGLVDAEAGLDGLEADLALARGRLLHGRFLDQRAEDDRELELFARAAELFGRSGDSRGEAEARFWIGCCHQVVRDDDADRLLDEAAGLCETTAAAAIRQQVDEARADLAT